MVFKRYIKRGGKRYGPYYYESYRDSSGKVHKRYLGTESPVISPRSSSLKSTIHPKSRRFVFLSLLVGFFVLFLCLFFFFVSPQFESVMSGVTPTKSMYSFVSGMSGYVVSSLAEETVNEHFDREVNLVIKDAPSVIGTKVSQNKNDRMDFNITGGLRLYFDLISYEDFLAGVAEHGTDNLVTSEHEEGKTETSEVITDAAVEQTVSEEQPAEEAAASIGSASDVIVEEETEKEVEETPSTIDSGTSETEPPVLQGEETSSEQSDSSITGNIVRFFSLVGRVVGIDVLEPTEVPQDSSSTNDTIVPVPGVSQENVTEHTGNHSFSNIISPETIVNQSSEHRFDSEEVKTIADSLAEDTFSYEEQHAVIALDNDEFAIVVNTSDNESTSYKWGYRVALKDLKFFAKISVTSNQSITQTGEGLLIGRNLLSFDDLVQRGYTISFVKPALSINASVVVPASNASGALVNETIVSTIPSNETPVISTQNASEVIEENQTVIEGEDVTNASTEKLNRTISEAENEEETSSIINNTVPSEEIPTGSSENATEPRKEVQENVTQEEKQYDKEETLEEKKGDTQKTEDVQVHEELAEASSPQSGEATLTGNIIRFMSIVGRVIGVDAPVIETNDTYYTYTVNVYIERDFSEAGTDALIIGEDYEDVDGNSILSVGDLLILDPTLSIIPATAAEHLDENRSFISNIYPQIQAQDDLWSEVINNSHYVRVTFSKFLTNRNDITLYARGIAHASQTISVYRVDNESEELARFENVSSANWYTIYLTNLSDEEYVDTFDLKINGSGVAFDYIVDPSYKIGTTTFTKSLNVDTRSEPNFTHLEINNNTPYNNLLAYWPFDRNFTQYGNITYSYTYGLVNNTNAKVLNNISYNTSGIYGSALTFNGKNGFVSIENITQTLGTNSTSLWYKNSSSATWTHVARNTTNFFINGVMGTLTEYPLTNVSDTNISIGINGSVFFNGSIDEVMLFNISLTAAQILDIYNNQSPRFKIVGTSETISLNITSGNNSVNVSVSDFENLFQTNVSLKLGQWEVGLGYNDSVNGTSGNGFNASDGLMLYLHMDNSSWVGENDTTVYDWSGNKNNGTVSNGAKLNSSANCYYGQCFSFTGDDETINVSNNASLNITTNQQFTISFWMKSFDTGVFTGTIMDKRAVAGIQVRFGTSGTVTGIFLRVDEGAANVDTVSSATVVDKKWHYIVAGRNTTDDYILVDAVALNNTRDTTLSDVSNVASLYIGSIVGITATAFNGSIDEFMFFNRTLTSAEITEFYVKGRNRWNYTAPQNFSGVNTNVTFSVVNTSTHILPSWILNGNNFSQNNISWYTPILSGNVYYDFYTYIDTTNPNVTINSPLNQTYTTTTISFNVTALDEKGMGSVNYTLDGGLTNFSMTNASTSPTQWTATNSTMAQGSKTVRFYAYDTSGNLNNSETKTFFIDSIVPDINFTLDTPANNTQTTNTSVFFNVSIVETNLDEMKWNWNTTNYTLMNDSLFVFYNFDNRSSLGENDTSVADLSGYENNASCAGTACPTWTTNGKYGGSFNFDGNGDNFNRSLVGTLRTDFAVSFWMNSSQSPSNQRRIIELAQSATVGFQITLDSLGTILIDNTGPTSNILSEIKVNNSNWHHVTAIRNGSNYSLYVDGILKNSSTGSIHNYTRLFMGIHSDTSTGLNYSGDIDEFYVWNRSLTSAEVYQLYATNLYKFNSTQWYLTVNQSQNATTGLAVGNYTYLAYAQDTVGNLNRTDIRTISIYSTSITDCTELTSANTVYNQTANIANTTIAGSACINITAENITFNGNGFFITSGQNVSGIYSNKFNTTIRHTNITMGIGTGNGIYLVSGANNATVFNNTFGSQFRGALLEHIRFGVFERNNFSYFCNNCYAIDTLNASFNNFTSNTFLGTNETTIGIRLRHGSDNNILTSNTAKVDVGIGISSLNTSHNIFVKNTGTSRNSTGITHTNDVNITSTLNNGTATGGDGSANTHNGIYLFNVSNSTFTSVIGSSNSSSGISLYLSFNNTFNSVIGISNVSAGVRIENSSNNVFTNGTQALGLLSGSYGFLLFNATGTNISDCINVSGIANDIYINVENRSTTIITNCSYDSESVNGGYNNLTRQWYYRAYVNDSAGTAVSAANVSAYNRTGQNIFTIGPTNASGFTNRTEIIDYVNLGGTITYYSNYTINATNGSSKNEHTYNVTLTGNKMSDGFSFDVTAPDIAFTADSPANNTQTSNTSVILNVSIIEKNLYEVKWNWNGTNFTLMNDSLVLLMNMDNRSSLGENDTWVTDVSGNGNNGTVNGSAVWNSSGKYNGAFMFDGINDYINRSNILSLKNAPNITFSLWIKPNSVGIGLQWLMHQWSGANGPALYFNNGVWWGIGDSVGRIQDAGSFSNGNWYHIVATGTDDGRTRIEVFVNGVPVANSSQSGGINTNPSSFSIGGSNVGSIGFFNGSIDEVMIWNRTLSSAEVYQLYASNLYKFNSTQWYLTVNQSKNATAGLDLANYTYRATAKDIFGNENMTQLRSIEIFTGNTIPYNMTAVTVNSSDGSNKTAVNLTCSTTLQDSDSNKMNVSVRWYLNNSLNTTVQHNNSYANGTLFTGMFDHANTTKNDIWGCSLRIFDPSSGSAWFNATGNVTIINTAPVVALSGPANGNKTTNRTPNFTWSGTDDDNDALEYEFNISAYYTGGGTRHACDQYKSKTIIGGNTSFVPTDYLKCLLDNGYFFNWTVRAYDGTTFGNWNASERNISIQSEITITLPTNFINFGILNVTGIDNTSDNSPLPFVIRNTGNADVNITVNVSSLWQSVSLPNESLRFKVRNLTDKCFIYDGNTTTNWVNAPITQTPSIYRLNFTSGYQTGCDNASVDIHIQVPGGEPSGNKTSLVTFISSLGEAGFGAD